jgi:hypothetical protein
MLSWISKRPDLIPLTRRLFFCLFVYFNEYNICKMKRFEDYYWKYVREEWMAHCIDYAVLKEKL